MYIFLIVIHVFVCLVLIAVILLQAGRGGGLTEAFGGESAVQSMLGTQAPAVLKKATEICAIAFLVTSLLLGMITARKGGSVFQRMRMEPGMPAAVPAEGVTPTDQSAVPAEAAATVPFADEEY